MKSKRLYLLQHLQVAQAKIAGFETERSVIFNTLLNLMNEGVILLDAQNNVTYMNLSAKKMLPPATGDRDEGENQKKIPMEQCVRSVEIQNLIRNSYEFVCPMKKNIRLVDDKVRTFSVLVDRLSLKGSPRSERVVLIRENTYIQDLESYRTHFVANVAHQLKTPLTSIQGFSETLINDPEYKKFFDSRDEESDFLKIILSHAKRLNHLVDDLLYLSKIEQDAENNSLEKSCLELKPLLSDMLELCREEAQRKSIRLELNCPESLEGYAHRSLLEQAVINLISNGIRYGRAGGWVKVSAFSSGEGLGFHIVVEDSGQGFSKKHKDMIFQRFYRIEGDSGLYKDGTGLGLAIVKHIVLAHKGSIDVWSEPGKGSRFTLHFI